MASFIALCTFEKSTPWADAMSSSDLPDLSALCKSSLLMPSAFAAASMAAWRRPRMCPGCSPLTCCVATEMLREPDIDAME
jgi:hypothetical protein